MRVVGIRKRRDEADLPFVNDVLPPERLDDLLRSSDVIVLAAPLTAKYPSHINVTVSQ